MRPTPMHDLPAGSACLALRRWVAQPHRDADACHLAIGMPEDSPSRARLASLGLRRSLPRPPRETALARWYPWLARDRDAIRADLMRAAGLALQREIRRCIHGQQRLDMIDIFGTPLYQELVQRQWPADRWQQLDALRIPLPDWSVPAQVLACGLALAHAVLMRDAPYLAQRLLLRFPTEPALPVLATDHWNDATHALASTLLHQEHCHDDD